MSGHPGTAWPGCSAAHIQPGPAGHGAAGARVNTPAGSPDRRRARRRAPLLCAGLGCARCSRWAASIPKSRASCAPRSACTPRSESRLRRRSSWQVRALQGRCRARPAGLGRRAGCSTLGAPRPCPRQRPARCAARRRPAAMGIPPEFQQVHSSLCLHIWLLLVRLRAEGKDGKQLAQVRVGRGAGEGCGRRQAALQPGRCRLQLHSVRFVRRPCGRTPCDGPLPRRASRLLYPASFCCAASPHLASCCAASLLYSCHLTSPALPSPPVVCPRCCTTTSRQMWRTGRERRACACASPSS